jgi:hypothetical protein
MADKPELRAVPYENGSYYRLRDKKLIVVVMNYGKVAADATTQVDFAGYGSCKDPQNRGPQDPQRKNIAPGKSVEFEFDCPSDNCFDPDCEFYIAVKSELAEESSVTFGVCRKPMVPYLTLVPVENDSLIKLLKGELIVKVQNQGAAYARSSNTKLELEGYPGIKPEKTPELEPGYTAEVKFKIPQGAGKSGAKYSISLDIDKVVHVPEQSGKHAPRVYYGSMP